MELGLYGSAISWAYHAVHSTAHFPLRPMGRPGARGRGNSVQPARRGGAAYAEYWRILAWLCEMREASDQGSSYGEEVGKAASDSESIVARLRSS